MADTMIRVTFRLERDSSERIDRLAEKLGLTRSEVIRQSLARGLEEGEKVAKSLRRPSVRTFLRVLADWGESDPAERERLSRILDRLEQPDLWEAGEGA